MSIKTDKPAYGLGEPVVVTVRVKNISVAPCRADDGNLEVTVGGPPDDNFVDSARVPPGPSILTPGTSASATYTWNQQFRCGADCVKPATRDIYVMTVGWIGIGFNESRCASAARRQQDRADDVSPPMPRSRDREQRGDLGSCA